jgi:hypothetical protein
MKMSVPLDLPPNEAPEEPEPTWRWLFADAAGVVIDGPEVVFTSQEAAEDWLREQFTELADDGVATVSLVDGEHAVYGPMYLAPEGDGSVAEAEI